MSLSAEPLALPLKTPWRIAHGTSKSRTNALVRLDGGLGEGALPPYSPYRVEDVQAYVEALDADALLTAGSLNEALDALPPGPPPARTALDLALHDRWGQALGHPLYRLWGLNPLGAPISSVALSIPEDEADLRAALQRFDGFPLFKLKVGTGDLARDEAIVRMAHAATSAQLCIDANAAWSVDDAATILPRLAGYDLLFIEQPLPKANAASWHALRRRLPNGMPPLIADESVQTADDVLALAGAADGVNLKLVKHGGLRNTRRLIELARAVDLQVMIGCMIESSVALTAAAHLAPLADYLDLDGMLHLTADPFEGVRLDRGQLVLPDRPGLGCVERWHV